MSPDRFDDAVMGRLITKATDRLSLFTAPATLDRTYNLDPETYVRVLDQVRSDPCRSWCSTCRTSGATGSSRP